MILLYLLAIFFGIVLLYYLFLILTVCFRVLLVVYVYVKSIFFIVISAAGLVLLFIYAVGKWLYKHLFYSIFFKYPVFYIPSINASNIAQKALLTCNLNYNSTLIKDCYTELIIKACANIMPKFSKLNEEQKVVLREVMQRVHPSKRPELEYICLKTAGDPLVLSSLDNRIIHEGFRQAYNLRDDLQATIVAFYLATYKKPNSQKHRLEDIVKKLELDWDTIKYRVNIK